MFPHVEPSAEGKDENKRRFRQILGAIGGIFIVGGLAFVIMPHQRQDTAPIFSVPRTAQAVAGVGRLDAGPLMHTEARGSSLYEEPAAQSPSVEDVMTVEQLMGVLKQKVSKPTAEKVAKAFMAEPQLASAWNNYQKKHGPDSKAKEFVDYISRLPKIDDLMQKFQNDADVSKAFSEVMKTDAGRVFKAGVETNSGAGRLTRAEILRRSPTEARSSGEHRDRPVAGGGARGIGLAAGPRSGRGTNLSGGEAPGGTFGPKSGAPSAQQTTDQNAGQAQQPAGAGAPTGPQTGDQNAGQAQQPAKQDPTDTTATKTGKSANKSDAPREGCCGGGD